MDDITGAGRGGGKGPYISDAHQHSVNAQSLHILQIIAELNAHYPRQANVSAAYEKLEETNGRMWRWMVSLGLIEGEPAEAALTITGKEVLDRASTNEAFKQTLRESLSSGEADDRHAAAVLVLLHTNHDYSNGAED